ncbi:MAG: peptidoglycan DD-metalloendopeptidase family protein [Actinobacteria bacterium]|nr:peptidoglycan DD-metalloendopeptidase family protein [Actinomycetota bacterium]
MTRTDGMIRTRTTLVLVVVALLGVHLGPAHAAARDPRAAREQARDRKAQLAKELDGLAASEEELLAAVAALDDQVDAQSVEVDAARQAVAAADGERAEAERAMAETGARIDGLKNAVVERAIASFIRPSGDSIQEVVQSSDIAEAARKQALLDQVTANDEDVIDELNAARQDFEVRRAEAEAARAKANERRAQTEARLVELQDTLAEQARLAADVQTRQREVTSEIEEQSRSEAELSRIIQQAEAQQQRSSGRGGTANLTPGAGGCIWPTSGRVTSGFGTRWGRLHAGVDIGAPTGTPIWATKDGTVIFSGVQSGYGNVVILSHGGGLTTLYGHQSRIAASNGQRVGQGDTIGYVGSTGRSTGPHLHFETRYGSSPRDPRGCLP